MPTHDRLLDYERFVDRHIGPDEEEVAAMLAALGASSLEDLMQQAVPADIRLRRPLALAEPLTEVELLRRLRETAARNRVCRSFIGLGYAACVTPSVILRNVLENPGWYTQYTPYQAEISQGRLEALLNFQTMVIDLTAMEIANASLLDEATAAGEAMAMLHALAASRSARRFLASDDCHPQTLAVVRTRAEARGWELVVADPEQFQFDDTVFGALVQYPASDGAIRLCDQLVEEAHAAGVRVAVATDLLALCLLRPPGEFGADVVVGSTQRFGMPPGYGGPHAAFLATREAYRRQVPGRIVGVSVDSRGRPALRMALQTREQHIRRERATSNICTAEVLPAVVASMYAVYHGPRGLRRIARRVHACARLLGEGARRAGHDVVHAQYFDTLRLRSCPSRVDEVLARAAAAGINLRRIGAAEIGVTVDEATDEGALAALLEVLSGDGEDAVALGDLPSPEGEPQWDEPLPRRGAYLSHPVFNSCHSETEMLRYLTRLQSRDLSLAESMIPLGSCTMKLNATTEMMPITWREFAELHPFAPVEQAGGYHEVFEELADMLKEITGFEAVSLQPNAGSQGEFTGLLILRRYLEQTGQGQRDVCLIPASAHGTNPASAVMAGLQVVVVACDEQGNVDLDDLQRLCRQHADRLAALMVTYPSTHGVFEPEIRRICALVHQHGGQVYMDGANMNALVGICRPADVGVDVCHLNLHKTFAIPHGGGGPGMGPVASAAHLADFMPRHPLAATGGERGPGAVSAAPWGSALVLLISWAYLRMMGASGLVRASQVAILNANYVAHRLDAAFPVLYSGRNGRVAHEAILDLRDLKASADVTVEDVAKRLMDYGFHAPTISFPVAGTVMVEPTESESRAELDRFCDAMIAIREEIRRVESGEWDRVDNPLHNAPHTASMVSADDWPHRYSRQSAAFPAAWQAEHKFWPSAGRVDGARGDRQLVCACVPVSDHEG